MECFDIHTHSIVLCPEQAITSFSVGMDMMNANATHISVGIHPWSLTLNNVDELLDVLYKTLKDKRVVALGEAGLDKLKGGSIETQIAVFRKEVCNMSVDCDCCAKAEDPCMKDIGILSSTNPVALDKACMDLIYKSDDPGKEHFLKRVESRNGVHTIDIASKLFNFTDYELINIDVA